MKLPAIFSTLLASGLLLAPVTAITTTQTVSLAPGWNSVWLEVEPTVASGDFAGLPKLVEDVFSNPAVEIVASRASSVGTAEFVADATVSTTFNQSGWSVWRQPSLSQLGNNTLLRVRGNRPYLVKTSGAVTLNITGKVEFFTPRWDPSSYSLVGFSLTGPVTFAEFFQGSAGAHDAGKVQKLTAGGAWQGVQPGDTMDSHTAYWVFAERDSDYMGPVSVLFDGSGYLSFGAGSGTVEVPDPGGAPGDTLLLSLEELTFTNIDSAARTVSLEKVLPAASGGAEAADDLRLYEIVPQPGTLDHQVGGAGQVTDWPIGSIDAATTKTVTAGAHRNWMSGDRTRENLYRINVGIGGGTLNFWLPVRATNASLLGGAELGDNAAAAGLWVGSIRLNEVTSITEPGGPLRPASSTAPLRVLLHVDAGGAVSMLSHVMIMQTKTADESVSPETVLVVDESKIPFFEGIEERGGKRIGRRVETAAFDMPRKMDTVTQTDLLGVVATALDIPNVDDVTQSDLVQYVNGKDSRPPKLVEDYAFSWPLDGGLDGGGLVATAPGSPLLLDPFHRSNPFRHAFHPQHGSGFPVERHLKIILDEQTYPDRLTGLYEETLTGPGAAVDSGTGRLVSSDPGLAAFSIVLRGPVTLRRISTVGELQ